MVRHNKKNIDELSDRILEGVNKALRSLAEKAAANDESLVIGDRYGKIRTVSAKELLKGLAEKNS